MAVSSLLPDSSVESVKQAVRSTSTCNNTTVLTLQSLFRGPSKSPTTAGSNSTTVRRNNRATISTTRTKPSRGAAKTKETAINTLAETEAVRLSFQEKLVLATEVFNTTLKTLSDAIKTQSQSQPQSSTSQPTSPNRTSRKPKSTRGSPTPSPTADTGLADVAECATMALASLRTLKSESGAQENGTPNIQLEQGACVLAGRYLSLGLIDMAYKELRGLKRRIQQYLNRQSSARKKGTDSNQGEETTEDDTVKERMSDLLMFSNFNHAKPLLGLIVAFQSNVLRLIVAEKKVATIQRAVPLLQLSDSTSPAKVIIAAMEAGALPKDKAALQLQSLSHTVLSLCFAAQSTKPITSLTLQLLSLEIRCLCWETSGHVCDEVKEMWDPLARYLTSFVNHSKGIEKTEFASVYTTVVRLQSQVSKLPKQTSVNPKENLSVARIATILGQLAQEVGCFEEALTLFTESLGPLSSGQCLSLATVRCKIASLHFQASKASKKFPTDQISTTISEATEALSMPLKGSSTDLDELLIEASKLKKLAMGWFGDMVAGKLKVENCENNIPSRIYQYLPSFLRFLRRYIGRPPSEEDEQKEFESFSKRVSACRSIALAAVDSTVAVGKLSVLSQRPKWDDILSALLDCQRLLIVLEPSENDASDPSVAEQTGLGFVKLSNLFWSRYIKEKENDKGYRDLLPLLKQSANLLSSCSPSQRSTGFAALKYERLAQLYMEGNASTESGHAFFQSIKENIETGALEQIIPETGGCSPHRMGQDPKSSAFMLSRVFTSFLKMKLRSKSSKLRDFYDDEDLDSLQRGHVLEWQMGILIELQSYANSEELFRSCLSSLVSKTLGIYSSETHPIRRQRVMLSVLRLSLENPSALEPSLLRDIVEESSTMIASDDDNFSGDIDLDSFATSVKTSIRLTLGLRQGDLQPDCLQSIISAWKCMLQNCQDRDTLISCVGDVDHCLLQMKAVIDYTEIHGLWKLQIATLELLLRVTELQGSKDFSEGIIILSRLVLQYCRLGYCKRASGLLHRADQCLTNDISCLATVSHKLARVGYLLEIGDLDQAASVLSVAGALYEKNQKQQDLNSCSVLSKIAWERLVADAAFMSSRVSFAQGSIKDALFFAKLAVRLNCRIWAKVEKIAQRKQDKLLPSNETAELETVVEGMAKLDVSQSTTTSASVSYTQGAPFWPHIGSHHTSLLHLANLSAYHGLFQDAVYYGEQAMKVNKTLNANVRLVAAQAQLGSHWIYGGHLTEGKDLLTAANSLSRQLESSVELVSLQLGLASLHRAQGDHRTELKALSEADKVMTEVVGCDVLSPSTSVSELEDKMDKMQIREPARKTRQRATTSTTTTRRTRGTTQSSRNTPKVSSANTESAIESNSVLHLRSDILRQQASCSRTLREFEKASHLLHDARKFAKSRDSQISLHIGESEHLLADAIRHFASHAVYCVLPESTISLPALQSPSKGSSENNTLTKNSTTRRARAPTRGTRQKVHKATEDFSVMLSRAGDCLSNVFPAATALGSTLDSHTASRLMSRISMLFHTTAADCTMPWSQSPANVNEIGRIGAFAREHAAIGIDKRLTDYCDPLLWPTTSNSTTSMEEDLCSSFTKDYVDILPDNWNVLSLSLSADRTEFVVSRLHQGRSPFLLRLPLKRGNSEDEEEQFSFEDGKEEMQELIKLANESAHAAKAQTDRQSKKEWWKNREALDRRMENLLVNIENVWFGGFRGIFSPVPHDSAPLARFASSFQNILDKHLPSRQKGGRTGGPKLTLHPNVLELFIGVKDLEDHEDPEETLIDLLYFVVDILQFQGERNAYDEIDFDMMVVETLDALRGYHDAVQNGQGQQKPNHTVLILDKALHLFPWESLPCLQGFPVCRAPSLECLRDRIVRSQGEHSKRASQGLSVNRRKGTYILNPTGDLSTTQGTFEKGLSALESWTGIVNRQPTEDEFKQGLESNELFLYFGHGSGAQYIRGRTVKRLDRCAVAFLMGCSSGSLTEAGEYEPYGTPMNYLHAGSPALVATLWDVTDKDIDRFAKSAFESWGLLGETGGKKKALDEAVSGSREACVLKYLNGAAPVVYGVPGLFLD